MGRLCGFQVDENERGKGYGKFLMNNFAKELKNMGGEHITVTSTQKSYGFYEKYGFKPCGNFFNRWSHGLDHDSTQYIKLKDIDI